jgi:hypothetical protein
MPLPANIAPAILDTITGRLAPLFLAGAAGDAIAARDAASQMLVACKAETPDELILAAEIVSLQFHTLEALACAADPDLSLNKKLRLRGSAVSLSRESHKAQRRLDQLQRARSLQPPEPQRAELQRAEPQPAEPSPTPASPTADDEIEFLETAREVIRMAQKSGGKNWSQALQKRLTTSRMAEKTKKMQAEHARRIAHPDPATLSAQPAAA